jgi:predicted TIM-barrel enzyme
MNTLLLILKLFPVVLAAVQSIEAAAPVAKTGPQKLDLLMGIASAALATNPDPSLSQDKAASLIKTVVDRAVGFLNLVGIFKKSA